MNEVQTPLTTGETARYAAILSALHDGRKDIHSAYGEAPFVLSGYALNLIREAGCARVVPVVGRSLCRP